MNILGRLVVREATRAVRSAQRRRLRALERELTRYSTASDRADLAATLDRYPDHFTADIRTILSLQAMSDRRAGWQQPFAPRALPGRGPS